MIKLMNHYVEITTKVSLNRAMASMTTITAAADAATELYVVQYRSNRHCCCILCSCSTFALEVSVVSPVTEAQLPQIIVAAPAICCHSSCR